MDALIAKDCSICGGMCCKVIVILKDYCGSVGEEMQWVKISPKEALTLNPFLNDKHIISQDGNFFGFFSCSSLTQAGLCSIYSRRPEVCRGYPFYGMLDLAPKFSFVVPWCKYREDALILEGKPYRVAKTIEEIKAFYSIPEAWLEVPDHLFPCRRDFFDNIEKFVDCYPNPVRFNLKSVPHEIASLFREKFRNFYILKNKKAPTRLSLDPFFKLALWCMSLNIDPDVFFDVLPYVSSHVRSSALNSAKLRGRMLRELKNREIV